MDGGDICDEWASCARVVEIYVQEYICLWKIRARELQNANIWGIQFTRM